MKDIHVDQFRRGKRATGMFLENLTVNYCLTVVTLTELVSQSCLV